MRFEPNSKLFNLFRQIIKSAARGIDSPLGGEIILIPEALRNE
jgi:hypothetical protein